MAKFLSLLAALLLVAGAVFLPAQLSNWEDQQLLDDPHITQHEEREGFAESVQMTVGEKLLLLQSETSANLAMPVSGVMVQGLFVTPVSGANASAGRIEDLQYFLEDAVLEEKNASEDVSGGVETEMEREARDLWSRRLMSAWNEVRSLQAMGGLPDLWPGGSSLEFFCGGTTLYVDSGTGMSFQVYQVDLSGAPYALTLVIDGQSGQVLRFTLRWGKGTQLNWGHQRSSGFGTAWRDYWGVDSVDSSWHTPYIQEILESTSESLRLNGDYNANGQINFEYDGQRLAVPLRNWVFSSSTSALFWGT